MKYVLEKKIWLRAGTHRVFLGVPESNSTKTVTVNLQEGKSYTLEFRPIYPRHKAGHPSFRNGFLGFNFTCDQTREQLRRLWGHHVGWGLSVNEFVVW